MRILAFLLFFHSLAACQSSAVNLVFQSTDGGTTWQDVSAGLPVFLEVGCIYSGKDEVLLGSGSGLYHSRTASAVPVWQQDTIYLPEKITGIFPGKAGPYICSYGKGFFQETGSGTGIWKPMHTTLPDKRIHSVLETPDGAVFVACKSGIFKSTDGTKTWKQVSEEGFVYSLVASDGVLVGGGFRGILRSTDGGAHWDWALTEAGATFQTGLIEGGIAAITYDGSESRYRASTDNGKTWQQLDDSASPVRFLSDIKQAGEFLFYGHDAGVYRSSDQGKTWQLVLPVIGKRIFDVVVSGKTVYAVRLAGC